MRLALLCDDPAIIPCLDAITADSAHEIVMAVSVSPLGAELLRGRSEIRLVERWEDLLVARGIDAILVGGHEPTALDAVKQLAGTIALDFRKEMDERVSFLVEERGRLATALADLPVSVWPSGANFVLFRPENRAGAEVWQELVDRSVLVRNCASWPGLDGCLRVTVGTRRENEAFLTALADVLRASSVLGSASRSPVPGKESA